MSNTLNLGDGKWAAKEGSLLAYNSENGNYKPLPFDFSRDSSATVINKDGLIETVGSGQPRIDYKDDSKGALLLEPTRTNYITYSEDFSQGSWTRPNINVTTNVTTAPNGITTADLIQEETNGGSLRQDISVSGQLTFSFYLKYASGTNTSASLFCTDANQQAGFNLQTGVVNYVSGSTATIENSGNGWYRCSITFTSSASSTIILFPNYESGIGGVYAWGAQVEQGSYPTSYIPTQGGVVTRLADVCTNGGNEQVINSTEGTLYLETATLLNTQTTDNSITLTDGGNNKIIFRYRNTNAFNVKVFVNGVAQAEANHTLSNATDFNKIAVKWKLNDYEIYVNGISVFTDSNALVFPNNSLNTLDLADGTSFPLFGKVKDLKVYNTALTDAELQALTT